MREIAPHIVIDPKVRFGKPTIKGTRITLDEVLGFLAGGMGFEEIDREYGLNKGQIQAAVDYAAAFIKGEEVRLVRTARV